MSDSSDFGSNPSPSLGESQFAAVACSKCSCTGIHACTGAPIVWPPGEVQRFHSVLNEIFGLNDSAAEPLTAK